MNTEQRKLKKVIKRRRISRNHLRSGLTSEERRKQSEKDKSKKNKGQIIK